VEVAGAAPLLHRASAVAAQDAADSSVDHYHCADHYHCDEYRFDLAPDLAH
jgi:hypothetical protein